LGRRRLIALLMRLRAEDLAARLWGHAVP